MTGTIDIDRDELIRDYMRMYLQQYSDRRAAPRLMESEDRDILQLGDGQMVGRKIAENDDLDRAEAELQAKADAALDAVREFRADRRLIQPYIDAGMTVLEAVAAYRVAS